MWTKRVTLELIHSCCSCVIALMYHNLVMGIFLYERIDHWCEFWAQTSPYEAQLHVPA